MNNETQQQPQVAENWFLKPEILAAIREMEESELKEILLGLADTRVWIAILKYVDARYKMAQGGLAIYDPAKDATIMARCQGIMSGIMDLPEAVAQLKLEAKQAEQKQEEITQ